MIDPSGNIFEADGANRSLSEENRAFDALHYPSLLPLGDDTWHKHLPCGGTKRANMTAEQFYAYQLHVRSGHTDTLLRGERLFQEYIRA
jgi:hypothetical protein